MKKLKKKIHEAKSTFENSMKLRVAENKLNKKKKVGLSTISKSMSSLIKKLEVAQKTNAMQLQAVCEHFLRNRATA